MDEGFLRKFKFDEKHHYCIGVDASAGTEGSNLAAIQVICFETHEQAGAWSGIVQPDHLAEKAANIGKKFNDAVIAVEREKYGMVVINRLMASYPNLYFHTIKSTGFKPAIETQFGWNPRNKEEAVRRLQVDYGYNWGRDENLKKTAIKIYDKATLRELSDFVKNSKNGKYEAAWGKTDDLVSALYIANWVYHELKEFYVQEETKEEKKPWCEEILEAAQAAENPEEAPIWG